MTGYDGINNVEVYKICYHLKLILEGLISYEPG